MKKDFIVFGKPDIQEDEIAEVEKTLRSGWLGTGPKVKQFEDSFGGYIDAKHTIAVNSCTAALHLSLLSLQLNPGDEVLTTALTFCSTVNAIIHAGCTPVLVDVDPRTMNIDPKQIIKKLSSKSKVILPVHFAGRPCDMDQILEIAENNSLRIVEDCAHSIEAEYHGSKTGTFGDVGCFSFYVTKNIVTGEGGMVSTSDDKLAKKIKTLSLHGMSADAWGRFSDKGYKHYKVQEPGFKYNMMDIQASIGIHQLRRIEKSWLRRQEIWNRYIEAFRHLPITLPSRPDDDTRHAFHLFTILINENRTGVARDEFLELMTKKGIGVGVHYLSIAEHPYYKKAFDWAPSDTPNAMSIGRETVSLPLSSSLSNNEVDRIIDEVKNAFR